MGSKSIEERLQEILAQCILDLFVELGAQVELRQGARPMSAEGESTAAFSGFGGTGLRGSLALVGPSALFARLHPLPPTVTPRDLADWACEIVNQAVGRFRNQLLGYEVDLTVGLPQSALCEDARLSPSLRAEGSPIVFSIDGMMIEAWLELNLQPGFEIPDRPAADKAVALREGSLAFF